MSEPLSLNRWPVGQKGKVSHVHTQDRHALQKFIAMGVLPNTEITLIQKYPSYVFEIHNGCFTIDKELASLIYVQCLKPESS